MSEESNKGIIESIKSCKNPKYENGSGITVEDLRELKDALNLSAIPRQESIDIIGIKKSLNKLIKDNQLEGLIELLDENWNTF